MALATAAAAALAGSMYLEAKFALTKDIQSYYNIAQGPKRLQAAVRAKRCSLYYLYEAAALSRPKDDCIWSRTGSYTWAQTYARTSQYGHYFLSKGIRPGDLVAFYLANSPEFIFAWLGLWSIGAAPAMINHNLAGEALLHCVRVSGARLLLVDEEGALRARVEEVQEKLWAEMAMEVVVLDGALKTGIALGNEARPDDSYREDVKPDWPMCLFYTSGTTGMPKACKFQIDRGFGGGSTRTSALKSDDRIYNCMPMYHGTGGAMIVSALMQGLTICIGRRFSATTFWSDCHDSKATMITYVGETARYLLAAPPSALDKDHNVRMMYGNGLRPDVWVKFRERFGVPEVIEFFSSTEGVFGLVSYVRGDYLVGSVGHHGALLRLLYNNVLVPVSIDPITGAIARDPVTNLGIRSPYAVGGEMLVAVPDQKAFTGYYGNSDATAKKFERDLFQKGDLWYRTGDALRRDADGRWYFLDRLGDTFRWKGENVSTAEVAQVMGAYPGVIEANVYGVALPGHDGRAGCAAVYIDPGALPTFDFAGLLQHTRARLPKYAVPIFVRLVSEMTPIHNNKQNKVPLREQGVDPGKVGGGDRLLWIEGRGKGGTYVEFGGAQWDELVGGRARL